MSLDDSLDDCSLSTFNSVCMLGVIEVIESPLGELLVGVFSEAVAHSSEEEAPPPSLSSAVRNVEDTEFDLALSNLADRGRAPGIARTRDVALAPVGISTIRLRRGGAREVA